ncbi:MAG: hypothetical protein AAGD01_16575 [Acidobacteriota bacterium]
MSRRLFMIRNAPAENAEAYALFEDGEDSLRPLSPHGEELMQRTAPWIARQLGSSAVICCSPALRTRHSAEILCAAMPEGSSAASPNLMPELAPAEPAMSALRALHRFKKAETIALVGHEESLTKLSSWLISGTEKPLLAVPEGGICQLTFKADLQAGAGKLQWFLPPDLIDKLASCEALTTPGAAS